ncbi:two component transcriptional regulator, LuxR family [Micromonospora pattaloongensis]|uniref:Two component transcriptional regulator, LuxR family n=2 Tax=Micromonospora pattaloongensis TaxID=405436 RepID=A0A1H3NQ12_9ACTN|nr:two component transcriptional regulator, LuxR family [Micromonospora pattaloongensis]
MSPLTGERAVRVLFVEDHDMVAEALGLALTQDPGIEIIARVRSIAEAVTAAGRELPDVVLLDRRLPDGDGVTAIPRLRAVAPDARVLVITGEATAAVATRVVEAGGAGLLLKSSRLDELTGAVRRVAAGDAAFGPGLLTGVFERLTGRAPGGRALTARELETLALLAEGASTDEISQRLQVARNTARNHVQRILEKLGARSKLEAVAIARRDGLLD